MSQNEAPCLAPLLTVAAAFAAFEPMERPSRKVLQELQIERAYLCMLTVPFICYPVWSRVGLTKSDSMMLQAARKMA